MLDKLRKENEKYINKYKNNEKLLKKYMLIKKILENDDCFKKIDIETSYAILKDLGIPQEKLKIVYMKLID